MDITELNWLNAFRTFYAKPHINIYFRTYIRTFVDLNVRIINNLQVPTNKKANNNL